MNASAKMLPTPYRLVDELGGLNAGWCYLTWPFARLRADAEVATIKVFFFWTITFERATTTSVLLRRGWTRRGIYFLRSDDTASRYGFLAFSPQTLLRTFADLGWPVNAP